MELLKVVQGFNDLPDYRNTFLNLAINLYVQTEPAEAKKMEDVEMDPIMFCPVKAIPPDWTIWDTIELKGPLTVNDFMEEFKEKYKVRIQMITTGEKAIYNEYVKKGTMKERLDKNIEDIYLDVYGDRAKNDTSPYIVLDIGGTTIPDSDEVKMPKIKYTYR